jgi:hypothetical protein
MCPPAMQDEITAFVASTSDAGKVASDAGTSDTAASDADKVHPQPSEATLNAKTEDKPGKVETTDLLGRKRPGLSMSLELNFWN